jgi:hypothetical protein
VAGPQDRAQGDVDAVSFQCVGEGLALLVGHDGVLVAVDDQDRRVPRIDVGDGIRHLDKLAILFQRAAREEVEEDEAVRIAETVLATLLKIDGEVRRADVYVVSLFRTRDGFS